MDAESYMREALKLAQEALQDGEVPVGCVVVHQGEIVGRGRNRREKSKNALAHAELEAISQACEVLQGWRLWQCELYVTMEPCPMCAGAILNARIPKVFYGVSDSKGGGMGGVFDLFAFPVNHKPEVVGGILQEEISELLRSFFVWLREKQKQKKLQGELPAWKSKPVLDNGRKV